SFTARRLPPTCRDKTTRADSPFTRSSAPTSKRPASSLAPSTTNAPSTPCGRPTRPIRTGSGPGSVGNLEHAALVGPRSASAEGAARRSCDPPLLADHLADVVRSDVQVEHDRVFTLLGLHAPLLRLVDEPAGKPFE